MKDGKQEAGDLPAADATGFVALLGMLPTILRRAADADCVCGNCENKRTTEDNTHNGCFRLSHDVLFYGDDGPPWRECRLFTPSEEFKKRTADRLKLGDLLAEMQKGKKP